MRFPLMLLQVASSLQLGLKPAVTQRLIKTRIGITRMTQQHNDGGDWHAQWQQQQQQEQQHWTHFQQQWSQQQQHWPQPPPPPPPPPQQQQWFPSPVDQKTIEYISERLQEPQSRIVRAVVEYLGTATAFDLLSRTEQVQAQGGMSVPETGRPRTSGGIFLQLLKMATNLPRNAQDAALQKIKTEGKSVPSWQKAQPKGFPQQGYPTPQGAYKPPGYSSLPLYMYPQQGYSPSGVSRWS